MNVTRMKTGLLWCAIAFMVVVGQTTAISADLSVPYGHKDFVPTPERPVGFCVDGNSCYAGATPQVVEWWDGTPGWAKLKHRGSMGNCSPDFSGGLQEEEMRILTDKVPKNIIWKAPVPGWGDSQPIVVGKRIINCYWPHLVVCYDSTTGKELWRDELELALLPLLQDDRRTIGPAPDPKEGRNLQTLFELGVAMRYLSMNLLEFKGPEIGEAEVPLVKKAIEHMGVWRKTLETVCPEAVAELDIDLNIAKRFVAGEYEVLGVKGQAKQCFYEKSPQFASDPKHGLVSFAARKCKTSIDRAWPGWFSFQMSSPTSDGEIVAVRFSNGQVGAYEVATGKRLWAWRDPQVTGFWTGHGPSPRIGREVVVLVSIGDGKREPKNAPWGIHGIDKKTGAIRWFQPEKLNSGYPTSTPLLVDLDDGKGGILPVVIGISGVIYRQSDGKILCQMDLCKMPNNGTGESYTLHHGNLLVSRINDPKVGTGMFRLKVVSRDEVTAELVRLVPEISPFRCAVAMSDTYPFLFPAGRVEPDYATLKVASGIAGGQGAGPSIAGPFHISWNANIFDDKYRPREDGMCLATFSVNGLPLRPGDSPRLISNQSLLGGAEAPADLFFDRHLAGFDKMRQIAPKKWYGRYGGYLPSCFGHRTGGVVAQGDRLYIQSQSYLYCIGPAVQGIPTDDPKIVASIRGEGDAGKLATYLDHASAQYRYESVKRLGALKAALAPAVVGHLKAMLVGDTYEEIRAAAVNALDACDPQGQNGWTALVEEMRASNPVDIKAFSTRASAERRHRLNLTFRALGKNGPSLLIDHWSAIMAYPTLLAISINTATAQGWKIEPLLKSAAAFLENSKASESKVWNQQTPGNSQPVGGLPGYFAAIDAASDPVLRELLAKTYTDNSYGRGWLLYPTFTRHLPQDRLLSWIEPIAMESAHPVNRDKILTAWREIGTSAIPSMERVAQRLASDPKNPLGVDFAKVIGAAVEKMKGGTKG